VDWIHAKLTACSHDVNGRNSLSLNELHHINSRGFFSREFVMQHIVVH